MFCYYIDHEILSPYKIAKLKTSMNEKILDVDEHKEVFLSTCHRLELYTNFALRASAFKQSIGVEPHLEENVSQRLECIASGRKSQLLGERAIYFQTQKRFTNLPIENPYYHIGHNALTRANEYREKHNFYAAHDYENIIFSLLQPSCSTLFIVGCGMLGQMVARASPDHGISRTILITRDPKRRKKRLKRINFQCQEIYSFRSLPPEVTQSKFSCFIATDSISDDYRSKILQLVNHKNNDLTVNMSALPFLDGVLRKERYVTMYDDEYLNKVNHSNFLTKARLSNLLCSKNAK